MHGFLVSRLAMRGFIAGLMVTFMVMASSSLAAADKESDSLEPHPGFFPYFGVDIGTATMDTTVKNVSGGAKLIEKDEAWRMVGGFKLKNGLIFESFFAVFGEASLNGPGRAKVAGTAYNLPVTTAIKIKPKSFGLGVKYEHHLGRGYYLNGGLGGHYWNFNVKSTSRDGAIPVLIKRLNKKGIDPYYEVGFKKVMTDRLALVGGYSYFNMGRYNTSLLSIGVRMNLEPRFDIE